MHALVAEAFFGRTFFEILLLMSIAFLAGFALLTFVPLRYLYPSQRGRLNRLTNQLGVLWAFQLAWVLWSLPSTYPTDDHARRTGSAVVAATRPALPR